MFDIAGPVSVILGGYLSDKVFGTRRIPLCVIALVLVSGVTFFFDDLPATRLALGLGFFAIGFLLYIPDSLVSAAAAVDFGTRAGASTASGIINGCGSVGAIIGGTMPGWIGGGNPWGTIFPILAGALLLAGILLLPRWNALPRED
jgi:sugar phosphate permease